MRSVPTTFSARLAVTQTKPVLRRVRTLSTYHWCVTVSPLGIVSGSSSSAMGITMRSGHTSASPRISERSSSTKSSTTAVTVPSRPSGRSRSNSTAGFSVRVMINPPKGHSVGMSGCSVTRTLAYTSTSFTAMMMLPRTDDLALSLILARPGHATSSSRLTPMASDLVPTYSTRLTCMGSCPRSRVSK